MFGLEACEYQFMSPVLTVAAAVVVYVVVAINHVIITCESGLHLRTHMQMHTQLDMGVFGPAFRIN